MALQDNCVGYYKLESDGTDSVGTLGTASGTAPTYTTGKIGNGASFTSASSQYLETAAFAGSNNYSANFWYKPTTLSAQGLLCRDLVSGTNRVFTVLTSATDITLYAWGTGNVFHQTTTTAHGMSAGTWYMWSVVWDAPNNLVTLYKNGTSFTTITLTGNETAQTSSVKLSIGRMGDGTNYTNGIIDEVGYWTRSLTSTEISQLYNCADNGIQYPFLKSINEVFMETRQMFATNWKQG